MTEQTDSTGLTVQDLQDVITACYRELEYNDSKIEEYLQQYDEAEARGDDIEMRKLDAMMRGLRIDSMRLHSKIRQAEADIEELKRHA